MSIVGAVMVPHPPLILPEVGRGGERQIVKTSKAYEQAMKFAAGLAPETLVISSPHSIMYRDYFHISPRSSADGNFSQFGAPQVRIHAEYDTEFVNALSEMAQNKDFPAGTDGERDPLLDHATMIPLYFYRMSAAIPKIVRIGLSGLPLKEHYKLGQMIQAVAEKLGRRVVYVASGDLSHKLLESGPYGFDPAGPEYDERIMDVMGSGEFDKLLDFNEDFCDEAAECGHRGFVMMAGALDGLNVSPSKLSHEGITGVGYGVCTYTVNGHDDSRHMLDIWEKRERDDLSMARTGEDAYIRLARASVEKFVLTGERLTESEGVKIIAEYYNNSGADQANRAVGGNDSAQDHGSAPGSQNELLHQCAGAFVSIHENGALRGCIGTIMPTRSCLMKEIIANGVAACSEDPRFNPITEPELQYLTINVDVLGKTESINSPSELDVKRYGVIVTKGGRRGLLLPNLEGVNTVERQIEIASQKAGLDAHEKGISLERFEVVRHEV